MLPLIVASIALARASFAQDTNSSTPRCYWPNGEIADQHIHCGGNSSSCCWYQPETRDRDICYSNGFCASNISGGYRTGACTDQTWSIDSDCARQCISGTDRGENLITQCDDWRWCCGSLTNATSCCEAKKGFRWGKPTMIGWTRTEALDETEVASGNSTEVVQDVDVSAQAGNESISPPPSQPEMEPGPSFGAGIGVGIAIELIALAMAWAVWRLLGRRQSQGEGSRAIAAKHVDSLHTPETPQVHAANSWQPEQMYARPLYAPQYQELQDSARHELSAKVGGRELQGN